LRLALEREADKGLQEAKRAASGGLGDQRSP
jgi:hypothetical protein